MRSVGCGSQGCTTAIIVIVVLAMIGSAGHNLAILLLIGFIVAYLMRQSQRPSGAGRTITIRPSQPRQPWRSGAASTVPHQPEPVPTSAPLPTAPLVHATFTRPASGPALDLRLSFEASDSAAAARLVPDFVEDQVTLSDSVTRRLGVGWCEYTYRLNGPESILRELCAFLERAGCRNVSAFW